MAATDWAVIVGIFFTIAVSVIVSLVFWTTAQTYLITLNDVQVDAVVNQAIDMVKMFDTYAVMMLVIMGLTTVATSAMIKTHPMFVVPAILLMVIDIIISAAFSNAYYALATASPELTAAAEQLPLTLFVFNNLPMFVLAFSGLAIMATYGKVPGVPFADTGGGGQI